MLIYTRIAFTSASYVTITIVEYYPRLSRYSFTQPESLGHSTLLDEMKFEAIKTKGHMNAAFRLVIPFW
jgi:hypothetical protein